MDDKYKFFKQYDWNNSKDWQQYYENLYPKPPSSRLEFWKKKYYKLKVDSTFDINYQPQEDNANQNNNFYRSENLNNNSNSYNNVPSNNNKFTIDCIESCSFALFLLSTLPKFDFTLYFALVGLLIKIFKKTGIPQFNMIFLQTLFNENYFQQLVYVGLLLIDRLNFFSLFPIIITSIISVSIFIRRYLTRYTYLLNYANSIMNYRNELIRISSRLEIAIGFFLIIGFFIGLNSFLLPIIYWQYMRFKYILNADLKHSFSELNHLIERIKLNTSCPSILKFALSKIQSIGIYMSN